MSEGKNGKRRTLEATECMQMYDVSFFSLNPTFENMPKKEKKKYMK